MEFLPLPELFAFCPHCLWPWALPCDMKEQDRAISHSPHPHPRLVVLGGFAPWLLLSLSLPRIGAIASQVSREWGL